MRIALNSLGVLLLLLGALWLLQGVGIIPGSFMTGQTQWAVYGAIAAVTGLGLLILARRRP
jgi:hypothetical protein